MLRLTWISRRRAGLLLLALLMAVMTLASFRRPEPPPPAPSSAWLRLDTEQVAALAARFPSPGAGVLEWPRDHGPKPEQFFEHWTFSGRIQEQDEPHSYFYFSILRISLDVESDSMASAWAARDVYAGRLLVAPAAGRQHLRETLSRGALGLAGTEAAPARVWLEDWEIRLAPDGRSFALRAGDPELALDLELTLPAASAVAIDEADGARGYWWPGLSVAGRIVRADVESAVQGEAQLDRQWGRRLPLGSGQLALVRLWLAFRDGSALRCEQMRRRGGGGLPLGDCWRWEQDGSVQRIPAERVALEAMPSRSEAAGAGAAPWRLTWPQGRLELELKPAAERAAVPEFLFPPASRALEFAQHGGGWAWMELSNHMEAQ